MNCKNLTLSLFSLAILSIGLTNLKANESEVGPICCSKPLKKCIIEFANGNVINKPNHIKIENTERSCDEIPT